jgi:predicted RNA-binding Zn ribbon-like protein
MSSPTTTLLLVTQTPHPSNARPASIGVRSVDQRVDRQPGGRAPAPGPLQLVQAFVNTFWDLDNRGREQFDSPARLTDWLVDRGLLESGTRLEQADLQRALDAREGLRALLLANNGATPDAQAVERLNRALCSGRLSVQLGAADSPDLTAQRGDLDAALAVIGAIVAVAQLDGTWARLKACRAEQCGWAFFDHSRNQAGKWCAMSACGSRVKARKYRGRARRQRVPAPGAPRELSPDVVNKPGIVEPRSKGDHRGDLNH